MVGGAVIKFLEADRSTWWFYPIGLLIGFIAYQIVATVHTSGDGVAMSAPKLSKQDPPKFSKQDPRFVTGKWW